MSSMLNLMRLLRARIRDGESRLPREIRRPLPEVEQFERRFCLSMGPAAAIADLSSSVADAPPIYDETIGRQAAEADAADLPSLSPEDLGSVDLGNGNALSSPAVDAKVSKSEDQSSPAPSDDDASLVATADASGEGITSDAPETWETLTVAAPSGIRLAASADGESDAGAPEALSSTAPDLSSNGAVAANDESSSTFSSESHALNSLAASDANPTPQLTVEESQLDADEVELLLKRAAAATSSEDAIIAVVDRNGRILGVRMEADVLAAIPDVPTRVFAIDGAVAKARTAALFSNGDPENGTLAPLTSRTVRFISQSTITEREVESNPNVDAATAATSTVRGPGFVAPIGVGGHFPPEIINTPLVDLFGIEHTNRDSNDHPGADGVKGTADDLDLRMNLDGTGRFNIDPAFVPLNQGLFAPESYGADQNSGLLEDAQSRGIATLPGGIPLFRDSDGDGFGDTLIGGIGVFFPGPDGFATHEQGFIPGIGQTEAERTNAPKVLEAEYIAFAAAGGSLGASAFAPGAKIGNIGDCPPVEGLDLPFGRIDLVGITLEIVGPMAGECGITDFIENANYAEGDPNSGMDQPLIGGVDGMYRAGVIVPTGWLVEPHGSTADGGGLTTAQVRSIIERGIEAAEETRAAIRLPMGKRTSMVLAVTDTNGEVLGLYRMPDATTFSIDVAVAKARNVAYYNDAADLEAIDRLDPEIAPGTAFTNRTFRFVAQPRFPSGIDGTDPPGFSILNDDSIDNLTAENQGAPAPVSDFNSVLGHDAFFPMTNFRDPGDAGVVAMAGTNQMVANQNGIVFFPGSTPLYVNGNLVGGLGVSGDGVDQDDVVTFLAAQGFLPDSTIVRADQTFYRSVRLPFQKFLRNPFG
jgi:uncharacterized protein GlcG (DUF336 family)